MAAGPAAGQNPTPFMGTPPFGPPTILPKNGSTVGVGQPIIINFPGRVDDAGAAIDAVHVSSVPPVPGSGSASAGPALSTSTAPIEATPAALRAPSSPLLVQAFVPPDIRIPPVAVSKDSVA
ncbi:hypothetical protein A5660_05165 [Mycobacterium alsense]|nr:hypothetical protein A5660_05165 [Mycobacterium alsense]